MAISEENSTVFTFKPGNWGKASSDILRIIATPSIRHPHHSIQMMVLGGTKLEPDSPPATAYHFGQTNSQPTCALIYLPSGLPAIWAYKVLGRISKMPTEKSCIW